ncbi:NF041680 family putative transposase [Kitasatospora sp. NPDC101155]|uniref:NF041680 family putative transposase n=1 Tax=Kitasatospora sp. NPDC101155 TaxID=3364097 RepID=UPI0038279E93
MSVPVDVPASEALGVLSHFRVEFHECLYARADALFELTDALLCTDGPVKTLVELCLAPEMRRGHGAMYAALDKGWVQPARLRRALASLPLPRAADGRIVLAADVTNWLRPDATCSQDRLFCHVYGRGGRGSDQLVPGWPYSFIAALESGRTSWTALLDAQRLGPADDIAEVTATQLRDVVNRLTEARHWKSGDPPVLIVLDAGYNPARLSYLLRDLPVEVLARLRSDQVMYADAGAPRSTPRGGRPRKHGARLVLAKPEDGPAPDHTTTCDTSRYGTAEATSWDRMRQKLQTARADWADAEGELPVLHGTLIRLKVEHLPGQREAKPVWLWTSATALTADAVDLRWQSFLRRFDLEHTFRFLKQTLGWTRPKIRHPDTADVWTWLIIAAHTQLRLARPLTTDLRRPWERPLEPHRLTPSRVRRGFRHLRPKTAQPAGVPKPSRPGPGRPPGTPNRHPEPAPRTPPRRGQSCETSRRRHRTPHRARLNVKLRSDSQTEGRVTLSQVRCVAVAR